MQQTFQRLAVGLGVGVLALTAGLAAQAPVKVEMKDAQGQSIGTASLSTMPGMVHIQLDL